MADLPAEPLPSVSSRPVNGFGGTYYDWPFYVPTYTTDDPMVFNQTTWRIIDQWNQVNLNMQATEGVGLGMCLTALVYILVLTPNGKRGKPFHSFLLAALLFEMLRLLCDLIQSTQAGVSQYSAYLWLTNDQAATTYSSAYRGVTICGLTAACAAYFFTTICLYVQSRGLLSSFEMSYRKTYRVLMGYLIMASIAAFVMRVTLMVYQSASIPAAPQAFHIREATLITYTVSIGSWSLVSMCSVVMIIITRPRSMINRNSLYTTVLNLIALVCMESFIVPFIFCIFQIVPNVVSIIQPETMIIPSVLVLLPLGSLFMTVRLAESASVNTKKQPSTSAYEFQIQRHKSSDCRSTMAAGGTDPRRDS